MNSKEIQVYKIDPLRCEELRRVCWQFNSMKRQAADFIAAPSYPAPAGSNGPRGRHSDPTAKAAIRREFLLRRIRAIEQCARTAGGDCYGGLLLGVTTRGSSYEWLRINGHIFCGRNQYFEMRQKFFWLLDRELS